MTFRVHQEFFVPNRDRTPTWMPGIDETPSGPCNGRSVVVSAFTVRAESYSHAQRAPAASAPNALCN